MKKIQMFLGSFSSELWMHLCLEIMWNATDENEVYGKFLFFFCSNWKIYVTPQYPAFLSSPLIYFQIRKYTVKKYEFLESCEYRGGHERSMTMFKELHWSDIGNTTFRIW